MTKKRKYLQTRDCNRLKNPIHKFLKDYYFPKIEKLAFRLDNVHIIGRNEYRATKKMQ